MVFVKDPAGIYLHKVNNRNTRTRCEICLKLTIKIPGGIFIVNFEHISHVVLMFLLLTLSRYMPAWKECKNNAHERRNFYICSKFWIYIACISHVGIISRVVSLGKHCILNNNYIIILKWLNFSLWRLEILKNYTWWWDFFC